MEFQLKATRMSVPRKLKTRTDAGSSIIRRPNTSVAFHSQELGKLSELYRITGTKVYSGVKLRGNAAGIYSSHDPQRGFIAC
jgi:hypothetical protein